MKLRLTLSLQIRVPSQAESRRKLSGRWVVLSGLGTGHIHKRGEAERGQKKRDALQQNPPDTGDL